MEELCIGKKIGRWTLLNKSKIGYWKCKCECGTIRDVNASNLKSGKSKSCGCLTSDVNRKLRTTHGKYNTKLHNIWSGMIQRCYYKKHIDSKWYSCKNITMCDEWRNDFCVFYEWAVNNGYEDGLTIDRIDNRKGYYPENCRFATPKEQANNRSTNINIEYNGETKTLKQWSEYFDINYLNLYHKVRTKQIPFEEAILQY